MKVAYVSKINAGTEIRLRGARSKLHEQPSERKWKRLKRFCKRL